MLILVQRILNYKSFLPKNLTHDECMHQQTMLVVPSYLPISHHLLFRDFLSTFHLYRLRLWLILHVLNQKNTHILLLSIKVDGGSSTPEDGNAGSILNDPLFSSTTSTVVSSDCVPLISCMRIRDIYLYILNGVINSLFEKEIESSWYFRGSKVKNFQYFLNESGKTLKRMREKRDLLRKISFHQNRIFYFTITQKLIDCLKFKFIRNMSKLRKFATRRTHS
ncbi:hypothetical protein AGLY_002392 [Aphis glycines]|uniref:Uncharacterized protein n=1 Tax=Aphis glycines TaxID=307491 RepID=A0A6G0U5N3_APHGL|nr:hypothetical protein AGLY_002392 [Aphis glycines]